MNFYGHPTGNKVVPNIAEIIAIVNPTPKITKPLFATLLLVRLPFTSHPPAKTNRPNTVINMPKL